MERIEYNCITGEKKIIQLTPEEIAALPPPKSTALSKSERWELIKAKRDELRFNGGVKVGLNWFYSTGQATGEYNTLLLLSAGIPDTTVLRAGWRTMNGALIDMTPLLVKQILTAGFAQVAAIDDASQSHKTAMEFSATPETYDFSVGWPTVYVP